MAMTLLDREPPHEYIKFCIEEFNRRGGDTIVELGSMRMPCNHPIDIEPDDCPGRLDGHSTLLFAATGKMFHTVDINKSAYRLAQRSIAPYTNARAVMQDGIKFLYKFPFRINLLYLDAWDVDIPESPHCHLEAFKVVETRRLLHDRCLVAIDDTDVMVNSEGHVVPNEHGRGGKGMMLIPYMESKGWKILRDGRVTVLSR